MYNPRARFRHRLVALVLVLSPCSCGALLPEIEAPANVYKLTTKKPWVPDPDRGPEQPWVDVDPNVTLEANQCQLTLFAGERPAKNTARASVALIIGSSALAIAGGLTSTVLGLVADQDQAAIRTSTITAAGIAAAGGVISLITSLVRKEKVATWQTRRKLWDKGYGTRRDNPAQAEQYFIECTSSEPPTPEVRAILQDVGDPGPKPKKISYRSCLPLQNIAIARLASGTSHALMKCDLKKGESLEVKMKGHTYVTGKRPVDDWGGNLYIRFCFADSKGVEISDAQCDDGEVKSPLRGPFDDRKQELRAAETYTASDAVAVIVKLENGTSAELNFDSLEVKTARTPM
ncbi:MAG: hypothetical protein K1X67_24415 [Fimbriimonadaceae bacterium]|nr:hypothetical protein [Fimbriimonadaceae bacterium]